MRTPARVLASCLFALGAVAGAACGARAPTSSTPAPRPPATPPTPTLAATTSPTGSPDAGATPPAPPPYPNTSYAVLSWDERRDRGRALAAQLGPGWDVYLDLFGLADSIDTSDPALATPPADGAPFADEELPRFARFIADHADVFGVDDPARVALVRQGQALVFEQPMNGSLLATIEISRGPRPDKPGGHLVRVRHHHWPHLLWPPPAAVAPDDVVAKLVGTEIAWQTYDPSACAPPHFSGPECTDDGPVPHLMKGTVARGDVETPSELIVVHVPGSAPRGTLRRVYWVNLHASGPHWVGHATPRLFDAITGEPLAFSDDTVRVR
jgi:hypothetical protein